MSANFTPTLNGYSGQGAFRFWCQKVLPLVYDDSLSYMELLAKVVNYLNNTISDVATVEENVGNLYDAYVQLQDYVNTYFDNIDVPEIVKNELDEMAIDGTLTNLVRPLIPETVTEWLNDNVTPVGSAVTIDDSLSISGSSPDSAMVGGIFGKVENVQTRRVPTFAIRVIGTTVETVSSGSWYGVKLPTKANVPLYIKVTDYGTTYIPIVLTDINENVISTVKQATENTEVTIKVKIVPTVDGYIYISSRNIAPIIYNNSYWKQMDMKNNKLKIATINCGAFAYPSYVSSNWKEYINKINADIVAFQDATGDSNYVNDIISNRYQHVNYRNVGMYLCSKKFYPYETNNWLLTDTVGTEVNALRNKGIVGRYAIDNNDFLFIATIHLAPSTGYEALRAAQYQDIINLCENYERVVIMGDFNAQNDSEYDVFRDNGYLIGNGDLLPTFPTLRNIPADNIIVKGVLLDGIELIDTQNITDHNSLTGTIIY